MDAIFARVHDLQVVQALCEFKWGRHSLNTYELLPTNSQHDSQPANDDSPQSTHRSGRSPSCPCGPCALWVVSTLVALLALCTLYRYWVHPTPPPLFEGYRERERLLPQHNLSLPYPEGGHAKFLWVANHGSGFGWGNYMQEMVLNAYLAYAARRAYVFDNYTWAREGPEISSFNGKLIPARIPLSALITGPIIGGSTGNKDVPRAVSREYFFSVCPESKRVVLDTRKIHNTLGEEATVSQIVDRWVEELNSIQSPCVELARDSPALFSYAITNTKPVLDVYPALSQSPILSDFGWSPLVLEGFYNNSKYFTDFAEPESPIETHTTPLNGLLVLHIRRGDYESWCNDAYKDGMSFTGFNSFPALPNRYTPPNRHAAGSAAIARQHCLPSIPEILQKVLTVTEPHITRIYVMTNASPSWLADLKRALGAAHHWPNGIATSRDLELSWEGKFVSGAIDMHVGQRADIFIGNVLLFDFKYRHAEDA